MKELQPKAQHTMKIKDDTHLLELHLKNRSEATRGQYKASLTEFRKHCTKPLPEVNLEDLSTWIESMTIAGKAANTVRVRAGNIFALIRLGHNLGYILTDYTKLAARSVPSRSQKYITKVVENDLMWKIIKGIERADRRLFLSFLYLTGLRVTEGLSFRWSEVGRAGDSYSWVVTVKGGGQREVMIPDSLVDDLRRMDRFPWKTRNGVYFWMRHVGKAHGVDNFSAHWTRHSAAAHIDIVTGGDVTAVASHCGHSSLAQTKVYIEKLRNRNTADMLLPDPPGLKVIGRPPVRETSKEDSLSS